MKKPTRGKISEAAKRVAAAQAAKIKVVKKPGAQPVYRNMSRQPPPIEGLSLRDMMKETTARTRQLMREGDVSIISMRASKSGRTLLCQTVTRHKNKANTYYKQGVTNEDSEVDTFSRSRRLKVECTCPAFKFRHDWTLHQEQASDLKFSTDEPSYITNPQQLHGVCKHVLRVFNTIVKSGR